MGLVSANLTQLALKGVLCEIGHHSAIQGQRFNLSTDQKAARDFLLLNNATSVLSCARFLSYRSVMVRLLHLAEVPLFNSVVFV